MPSSLVFAALVLAWLVVLVPVVARRRQMVPRPAEADLSARVLPRAAGAFAIEEIPVAHHASDHPSRAHRSGSSGSTGSTALADRDRADRDRADRDLADRDLDAELDAELDREVDADTDDVDDTFHDEVTDEYVEYDDHDEYGTDLVPAPRSYRPGRGGFDPEAAAAAAESRYAFRQRVALGLIAVAVLSAIAALVVSSALWWLHLLADVALVGYLIFLRRQTRIEEDLRARRAARLSGERRALEARRERQAEHEERLAAARLDAEGWGPAHEDAYDEGYDDGEYSEYPDYSEYDDAEDDLAAARRTVRRAPAPEVPEGMELVSGDDDDPAFHELDGRERIPAYRRAAGV